MKFHFITTWSLLSFLLEPEDSITGVHNENEITLRKKIRSAGIIKALFWMVISIVAGLAVSNL